MSVFDDPALDDEPAWCAPARDRATETNQAIRDAITAERENIRQLALGYAVILESQWRDAAARAVREFAALIPQGDT